MTDHAFPSEQRTGVYRAIAERRDMRHFAGGTVEPELLERLLRAAHQAPSVGLMQPWRFIRITRPELREGIQAVVEAERLRTAEALGERGSEFMRLKVEGVRDFRIAGGGVDGRPGTAHFWPSHPAGNGPGLAVLRYPEPLVGGARRRPGHGLGVVVRSRGVGRTAAHAGWQQADGVLCLGPVHAFYAEPMLVQEGWTQARPLEELVFTDRWGQRE